MRVPVEHGDDRRRALGREDGVEHPARRASPSPRRACTRVGTAARGWSRTRRRPATPSASSRSAAASASGTIAPIATIGDGRARRGAGAAGRPRPPPAGGAAPARPGRRAPRPGSGRPGGSTAAGRPSVPSGRPSRASDGQQASTRCRARTPARSVTQPGCSSPIDGVVIDWCAPPSGASVTPDGVPTRIDWPPGVDPERPRLQRALDERVVEHADRQQRLAPAAPGRAELAEQRRPGWSRRCPARRAGRSGAPASAGSSRGSSANQSSRSARRPDADLVHPAAEVGRRADVGADA